MNKLSNTVFIESCDEREGLICIRSGVFPLFDVPLDSDLTPL